MNICFLYIETKNASTIDDHVESFQNYSEHNIYYIDISKYVPILAEINKFDVVIIHYTVPMFAEYRFTPVLKNIIRWSKIKKVVFIQDEYRCIDAIIDNLAYIKADLLFTCVPDGEIEKVYPKEKLPNLKKINTLTGFVPEKLLRRTLVPYFKRKNDVIYRGRKLPFWMGKLSQEKWIIGERFLQDALKYNLKLDISSLEKDRIYGENWVDFLENSKSTLGCESGASVFDFSGKIQEEAEKYEKNNPNSSYEEVAEKFLKGIEGKIKLNQISPRCFEGAALGILMILYEGEYSGVLTPWRHYVPLKKNHSNMKEVIDTVQNPLKWQKITKQAYDEIAINPKYSYKNFIATVDSELKKLFKNQFSNEKKISSASDFSSFPIFNHKSDGSFIRLSTFVKEKIMSVMIKILGEDVWTFLCYLRKFLKLRKYSYLLWLGNKEFCEEYTFLENLKAYREQFKFCFDRELLSLAIRKNGELEIFVDPDNFSDGCPQILPSGRIKYVSTNSLGIPSCFRGKEFYFKSSKVVIDVLFSSKSIKS